MTNGLRALVAVLIVAIAAGFWYFAFGPYGQRQAANQELQRNVAQAQQAISQAPRQDPATALTSLARARIRSSMIWTTPISMPPTAPLARICWRNSFSQRCSRLSSDITARRW